MSDEEYLWDKSGQPEPDLAHLERVLSELRWSPQPRPRYRHRHWAIAIAASLILCLGAALWVQRLHRLNPVTSWHLSLGGQTSEPVRAGQWIETAGATAATMKSEFIGAVDIEPNSRLRLLATRGDRQQIALAHGTIHALIWAPPTKFVVDTPSAKAVDLGCQYTLQVSKDGTGSLTVEMGWVAFQWRNLESFIPAGAACTTRLGHGPSSPHFLDAPPQFVRALTDFDLTGNSQPLNEALNTARPRDALTLWHLLQRTEGSERAKVFTRFSALVTLPPGVTQEAILRGDRKSLDAAWDALHLGDTSWWREWKRDWQ